MVWQALGSIWRIAVANRAHRQFGFASTALLVVGFGITERSLGDGSAETQQLAISWENNYLKISGPFPGNELLIHYLEAYCRPSSTDRDWADTVIPHQSEIISVSTDERTIRLRDTLEDGVVVDHTITVGPDEVQFDLVAYNPTDTVSQAHWAQPCIRVDRFTGRGNRDALELVPSYVRKCFIFLDGELTRLPTEPWAEQARYVPGQVYCPAGVDRNDVNPRPLSKLIPSNGLTGCFSADEQQIMAVAWEPYQEIFQGVIACIHSDLRLGGLNPGETKRIRGKIYIVDAEVDALLKRYRSDFPEHAGYKATKN
ncbi:MAG: hypothetical protein ACR2NU_10020 [Aeoliella sp.]